MPKMFSLRSNNVGATSGDSLGESKVGDFHKSQQIMRDLPTYNV